MRIFWIALSCLMLPAATALADEKPDGKVYEWPMKSGNAGWTGYSPDPRVKPPFRLKWATRVGGQVACVSVAGGRVYGRHVCLDAETGRILWKSHISSNTPTYEGGKLYGGGGRISAIDAATGKGAWSKRGYLCSRTYKTAVTACDGRIYAGRIKEHEGKKFYFAEAVDAVTGNVVWSTPLIPAEGPRPRGNVLGVAMSNAAVGGGRVFLSTHEPQMIFALDQKTGKELWRREDVVSRHAISTDGKTVWAAEAAHGLTALDAATGKKLWHWGGFDISSAQAHYKWKGTADHPPAAAYGKLFASCYGRNYSVIDAKTGKLLRVIGDLEKRSNMWGGGCGPLTAAGGFVYSNCMVGQHFNQKRVRRDLYAIDPETGKPVWRWPLSGKSCCRVAIAYGKLYAVTRNEIYCFEPVTADYKNEPQAPPAQPAAPPASLVKPIDDAGAKPKGGKDWPMYGGAPARCGLKLDIGLPIAPVWKFQTGDKVKSSPVIVDGTVYVGSDSGELFALDLTTGKKKWSAKIGSWVRCAPAVADGIVVCGADDGVLRAFDARTGKPKWEFKTAGRVRASAAVIGDRACHGVASRSRVVFGSWDGRCYCVRLSDGKEFWRYRVGDPGVRVYAPPAVAAGRVYVGAMEDFQIHALDLGTGKRLEGFERNDPPRGTKSPLLGSVQGMAVYRGLLVTAAIGPDRVIDATTGKILGLAAASARTRFGTAGVPAFTDGLAFTYRNTLAVRLRDVGAGRRSRSKPRRGAGFNARVLNTPVITPDLIIAATAKGTLEVRRLPDEKINDPAKLVWEWKSPSGAEIWTAPAAAGGFIVLGSDDGCVYGFSYSSGTTNSQTSEVDQTRASTPKEEKPTSAKTENPAAVPVYG